MNNELRQKWEKIKHMRVYAIPQNSIIPVKRNMPNNYLMSIVWKSMSRSNMSVGKVVSFS